MSGAAVYLNRPSPRTPAGRFRIPGVGDAVMVLGTSELADAVSSGRFAGVPLAVDTEGRGKDGHLRYELNSIQVANDRECLVFDPRIREHRDMVFNVMNRATRLYFHNAPHDVPILSVLALFNLDWLEKVYDNLVYARLAHPDEKASHSLGVCAHRYLGTPTADPLGALCRTLRISAQEWYRNTDLDTPAYRIMAASDAILTSRLSTVIRNAAHRVLTTDHPFATTGPNRALNSSEAWELVEREQIINRIHLRRQCYGLRVDEEYVNTYRRDVGKDIDTWESQLREHGIEPGNSAQFVDILDKSGLLPKGYPRTEKTKRPSGQAVDIERIEHPLVSTFLAHKRYTKVSNDYLGKALAAMDSNGRIRCATNVLAASTGRQSVSGDLPLQQLPASARGVIMAEEGESLVSLDWSQIEPVVIANIAGDTKAVGHYESGNKFYDALVTDKIDYHTAKTVLLAGLYGEGIRHLAHGLGVTPEEAKKIQDQIWRILPGVSRLAGRGGILQTMAQNYQRIMTVSGRIIPIPSGNWGVAVHKGVNYFVQGSAYDVLAESEVAIHEAGLSEAIYLAFHDELVVEKEAAFDIRAIMETPPYWLCERAQRVPKLRTSMKDLGKRWGK